MDVGSNLLKDLLDPFGLLHVLTVCSLERLDVSHRSSLLLECFAEPMGDNDLIDDFLLRFLELRRVINLLHLGVRKASSRLVRTLGIYLMS